MKKQDILIVGCGGAGTRFVDKLKSLDVKYNDFYVNSSRPELEALSGYTKNPTVFEKKMFAIPNAAGTGKNKELAKILIAPEAPKVIEKIGVNNSRQHAIVVTSTGGGTGSTISLKLAEFFTKVHGIYTTVIAILPKKTDSITDLKNSLLFWNDLRSAVEEGSVRNVMFVDNDRYDNVTKVDTMACKAFDRIFKVTDGKLDESDLKHFFDAQGYLFPLLLSEEEDNVSKAMNVAAEKSPFFSCKYSDSYVAFGKLNTEFHPKSSVIRALTPRVAPEDDEQVMEFTTVDEGNSILLLGGATIPTHCFTKVEALIKERENGKETSGPVIEDVEFTEVNTKNSNFKAKRKDSNITKDDESLIDDIFGDWNE